MPTYTSDTLRVSDGEITSHDTQTVADQITIQSAECRWQGITTSDTTTDTEYQNETNTVYPPFDEDVGAQPFPDTDSKPGPEWEFVRHELLLNHASDTEHEVELQVWEVVNDGSLVDREFYTTYTLGTGLATEEVLWSSTTQYGDLNFGVHVEGDSTECPDNQSHLYLIARTVWSKTTTTTTYTDTQDPFVTRDVDGSYTGTIADGNWTGWQSLSGLETGVNEFYHNISGSGEARFEFRYDWEYAYPEALKQLRIGSRDGSQIHKVALADPASSRLDYNHVRVGIGGTVYAVDVVDPSDPDAIEWARIGTQYGEVCPRAYDTIQL